MGDPPLKAGIAIFVEIGTGQPLLCNNAMYGAASLEGNKGWLKLTAAAPPGKGKFTEGLPAELEDKDALPTAEAD